jgi:hypothetical protein
MTDDQRLALFRGRRRLGALSWEKMNRDTDADKLDCLPFSVGGALLGILLRGGLSEHHLSEESKDVVKLGRPTDD